MKNLYYLFILSFLIISCEEEVPPITYTLTTQVTPAGAGTVDPASGTYDDGSSITISATPSENYSFKQWTGTGSGTANPLTFKIISNTSITAEFELIDADEDGVTDALDKCPDTPAGVTVNSEGCALSQLDSDSDGVTDNKDQCLNTPGGADVDENGCSDSQLDTDGDGISDDIDTCAETPDGETVDENGCSDSQKDTDGDGISDDIDTCAETPDGETVDENGCSDSQKDTDGDGISDDIDTCPDTPAGADVDVNGCEKVNIYLDENGVTVKISSNAVVGESYELNGVNYIAVDRDMLISMVLNGDDVTKVVTSLITNMSNVFNQKYGFNQDISSWDVSNVTNMKGMFYRATAFDDTYDISNWDVSNVTNMYRMFEHATSFNQNIGNWDISSVTDMRSMFKKATIFNQDISKWDVSNVPKMTMMFMQATIFNQDISDWDVSNVTDMSYMFSEAENFNQDISSWDVSNVSSMDCMFCMAFEFSHDLSKWCVSNIISEPPSFSSQSNLTEAYQPIWGTCPSKSTIWNGTTITFTKADGADPEEEANQDRITDNIWITRGNDGGQIFNIKKETSYNKTDSPVGTKWAVGTLDQIETLTFKKFRAAVDKPKSSVGKNLVMYLEEDDIYLSVKFTSWSEQKNGGFAYERSTKQ